VLISSDVEEDSLEKIKNGEVPKLRALQVHNSTVYRWNRPCYGISDNGKPHLRIENRVLPSGPTVLDEVSNAAFWLGAMIGMAEEVNDIRDHLSFEDVRDNFEKAARFGIDGEFNWFDDSKITSKQLILKKLLPLAEKGLQSRKISQDDIDLYLGVIRDRVKSHSTGARWMLKSYTNLIKDTSRDEALTVLTSAIITNQSSNTPVHKWPLPNLKDLKSYSPSSLKVSEFMVTDIFTVQKDDIVELVAELMEWKKIKYTPVEDQKGKLIGLVSSRMILTHLVRNKRSRKTKTVESIMVTNPITVTEDTNIIDAMELMREHRIGCLPVVTKGELAGIITEMDFLKISSRLLRRLNGE